MTDLSIKNEELEELIKVLESDNKDIYDIINRMILNINNLDIDKYNGIHRKHIDDTLYPYLKKINNNLLDYLNECTSFLNRANKTYSDLENNLENNIKNKININ